ncbi:MAG: tetratricopeptide repeat protein [Dehalococcoidia bacterium]|nr:MAG: tetratricopeptide repeat protein [Dehalococcoidia bacterium]
MCLPMLGMQLGVHKDIVAFTAVDLSPPEIILLGILAIAAIYYSVPKILKWAKRIISATRRKIRFNITKLFIVLLIMPMMLSSNSCTPNYLANASDYYNSGDYRKAIFLYSKAIELNPKDTKKYFEDLVSACYSLGQTNESTLIDILKQENLAARCAAIQALGKLGDPKVVELLTYLYYSHSLANLGGSPKTAERLSYILWR